MTLQGGDPRSGGLPGLAVMGSSGSEAMLEEAARRIADGKGSEAATLTLAISALGRRDFEETMRLCLKVLDANERNGQAWHLLAISHEARKDFATALSCYEAALALLPGNSIVLLNLSRLALTMGLSEIAERLIRALLDSDPGNPEATNNLAIALAAQGRVDEAIETLRAFLKGQNGHPNLLNTLGALVSETGDLTTANLLFSEALRLAPGLASAAYNLGDNLLVKGEPAEAIVRINTALDAPPPPEDRPAMMVARALALLSMGDLAEGWKDYEARNDPNWPGFINNLRTENLWRPGEPLAGRRLLVLGEQGLGDEVMFAGLLPDVKARIGATGELIFATEPRLVDLMSRSFPDTRVELHRVAEVGGHRVRIVPGVPEGGCDVWTPIASLLQEFRPSLPSFAKAGGYLRPDRGKVAYWRRTLEGVPPGPRVGLLWKSAVMAAGRKRAFSLFDAWEPILRTPGVTFVNLQYDDCEAELQLARDQFGVEIWNPPGIDLKQDLDDLTALSSALDLVIGFSNATFNLAAAAGAPAWLIAAKGAWTALGTDRYPWYPQVRLYQPTAFAEWGPVMDRVAGDLAREFGARV
ncbi:MAG: tetratricopeptide repeat protein [Phenylobacterium sp.]|uniref:tetratricopeptide repeat protein n=1 Tax=Phenylobacterium sp. TaxID=1871053 RepID=UPI0025F228AF|nr:tetratricopeptide repeat protein [Phenylobacterium sp.]MCA3737204.1 tetratricopeptide repeat protein [Phenylobacterium sp.]